MDLDPLCIQIWTPQCSGHGMSLDPSKVILVMEEAYSLSIVCQFLVQRILLQAYAYMQLTCVTEKLSCITRNFINQP